jgi:hypothetical protein
MRQEQILFCHDGVLKWFGIFYEEQ